MFEAISLNAEVVAEQTELLRGRAQALPDQQRKIYFKQYKDRLKDPDTYAVLNWFFLAGLHHMYLEKYLRGLLNLGVLVLGIGLLFSPLVALGLLCVGLILCVELMSLFRAQTIVADYNNHVAAMLLNDFEQIRNEV